MDFSLDFSNFNDSLCNIRGIGVQGTLRIKSWLVERHKYLLRDDYCQDVRDGKVNEI